MTTISRSRMARIVCGILVVFIVSSMAWGVGLCLKCKATPIDMPVSLTVGTVRTPEFFVKSTDYRIMLKVRRGLPLAQLQCLMGIRLHEGRDYCGYAHIATAIAAEWKVWDGERIVAQGSVSGWSDKFAVSDDALEKYLGTFASEANKKYVLELTFTKDGTALNEFKPRLIVEMY